MGEHEHKHAAPRRVACAVVTVSDTRTASSDRSGDEIRRLLAEAGHTVVRSEIIPDDHERIVACVHSLADAPDVDAVVMTGGTGISPRDNTYEALTGVLGRRIDGFGELFRYLSYREIGAAAMLSRATAGVVGSTVFFAVPGSTAACALAVERLILPELGHAVYLIKSPAQG